MLEELTESYADEIRETTEKLNNIGRSDYFYQMDTHNFFFYQILYLFYIFRMVKKDNSRNLALHLFDKVLEVKRLINLYQLNTNTYIKQAWNQRISFKWDARALCRQRDRARVNVHINHLI